METKHFAHLHPLTLCEIEDGGKPLCYGCRRPFSDDNYSCSNCQFYPRGCHACGSELTGSYYICKICWPNSLFFHKSCSELRHGICISCHPHSSLHLEVQFSDSDDEMKVCGFCDKIPPENGFTFCCYKCNFMMSFRCGLMLVNYHEGRLHIDYFGHKHPLTLLELADKTDCQVCYEKIHGPSYGCAPCEFYVHDLCRELKQEIQHPSHPLHNLTLKEIDESFETCSCSSCGFDVLKGFFYGCDECKFVLHPRCVVA